MLSLITFVYMWVIAFGSLTHSFIHHVEEKIHKHSLACINQAIDEGASDNRITSSGRSELKDRECLLGLALHSFSSIQIRLTTAFEINPPNFTADTETLHFFEDFVPRQQFLTSLSAQGPPA